MVAFAEGLTPTVDNSVDKSTTQVVGVLKLTGCTGSTDSFESGLTVYDSEKVKVDYSNPTNDYIQSLIDAAKGKTERLGQAAVDGHSGSCTLKPAATEKSESSYDNRVYTWVKDDESDDGILIGGPDSGAVGNQNRHMVITGDYARTTIYTVTVEVVFPDHVWGEGVVTQEATETEEGIRTFTCAVCQKTRTEAIPKLDPEQVQVIVEKPVYKGDIIADGMIHQITEFYDFSSLPEGTVIILNIDGETQYISVPDELQRLEVREPVEIPFELELPQGYIFENNAERRTMYCNVRVLSAAASVVDKPIYKGDIIEDGLTHFMSEFYALDDLPDGTLVIVTNDAGDEIFLSLADLKALSGSDPVDDSFTLSLPKGYAFADGSTRCSCPFKILASETQNSDADQQPESYAFIDGQNCKWAQNSNGTLTFRASGDFDKFTGVKIDGTLIDKKNYSAVSGSTVVTLKNDYLKTLAVGTHSLTVIYTDGDCSTNFEIKATQNPVAQEQALTPSTQPTSPQTGDNSNATQNPVAPEQASTPSTQLTSPQTGDNSNMLLWVMLLAVSSAVLTGTAIHSRKRIHN